MKRCKKVIKACGHWRRISVYSRTEILLWSVKEEFHSAEDKRRVSIWLLFYYCYFPLCSEQQQVDCSTSNYGCNGGWQDAALYEISTIGGLDTETSYPCTSGFNGTVHCMLSNTTKRPFNPLISTFLFFIFSPALASTTQLTVVPYPLPNRLLTSKLMTPRR